MIKFLKEKLKNGKYLRLLKKYTAPSKEFSNESRALFISELKKRGVMKKNTYYIKQLFLKRAVGYGFASLFALSSFTGGAIVYAQKENVDFNHPLYPMKRLGETIRVKLAPAEKKPLIQEEMAQKRLIEIRQLITEKEEEIKLINSQKTEEVEKTIQKIEKEEEELKKSASEDKTALQQFEEQKKQAREHIEKIRQEAIKKIEDENKKKTEELNDDFHETVNSVLKTIEPQKEELKDRTGTDSLCKSLRENIREHEEVLRENESWPDFEDKCDEDEEEIEEIKENNEDEDEDGNTGDEGERGDEDKNENEDEDEDEDEEDDNDEDDETEEKDGERTENEDD